MKKIVILMLYVSCLSSSYSSLAHTQGPVNKNLLTDSGKAKLYLTVGNLSDNAEEYSIEINGKKLLDQFGQYRLLKVPANRTKKIPLVLKATKPNVVEKKTICSTSEGANVGMFRTKVCTVAKVYWNKEVS
ncbi:hypothetical protein L4D09_13155 [Photobacterium makurazakiensis]|uniref:hypothetical protein n=1 Tax=Photobacterium makurazakiensis TaxID=2910234 RepID=UPI003D0B2323